MQTALATFAFTLLVACGGGTKNTPATSTTGGDTTGGATTEPAPADKTCHDLENCEGHGTCLALCEGNPTPDCEANCDAQCPVIPCPAS